MQTRITARHTNLPAGARPLIEAAVARLERYYDGIHDAHVVLEGQEAGGSTRAEVKVNVSRRTLTAQEAAPTYQEAVNGCVRQLRRQVLRYKDGVRDTSKNVHR
ncbi:MAG: HPF/RaiA family ribosome-associated protein [Bacteroidota bacterium]